MRRIEAWRFDELVETLNFEDELMQNQMLEQELKRILNGRHGIGIFRIAILEQLDNGAWRSCADLPAFSFPKGLFGGPLIKFGRQK